MLQTRSGKIIIFLVAVSGLSLLSPSVKHTFMPFYLNGHIKKEKCSCHSYYV